jgi:cytochrome P450
LIAHILPSSHHLQNTSVVLLFFVAMLLFPDVAHKLQEEITNVIGSDRLPTAGDRANLPYAEAVWKEAMRWNPAGPFGE